LDRDSIQFDHQMRYDPEGKQDLQRETGGATVEHESVEFL
jgi:hypothetical protein